MGFSPGDCKVSQLLDTCLHCQIIRKIPHTYLCDTREGLVGTVLKNNYRRRCSECGTETSVHPAEWEKAEKRYKEETLPHL